MRAHEVNEIFDDTDEFVKKINFYMSPRAANGTTKDFIGSSNLTHKQLLDPDYGPGIKAKSHAYAQKRRLKRTFLPDLQGKRLFQEAKDEFHKRVVAQMYEPLYDFETIHNMEQQRRKHGRRSRP